MDDSRTGLFLALLYLTALAPCLRGVVELSDEANFSTGFNASEGYAPGYLFSDSDWEIIGTSQPLLGTFGLEKSLGLELDPDGVLAIEFSADAANPVGWIDFRLRPAFGPSGDLPVDFPSGSAVLSGFVRDGEGGLIYVLDGDGQGNGVWRDSGHAASLDGSVSADWLRLTYRLDYTALRWDLFLDGQLQAVDLGFADPNAPPLSGFILRGASRGATRLDQFEAGFRNPLFPDADNDGMPDAYEDAQGLDSTRDDRGGDNDFDTLRNIDEYRSGLSAGDADTDGDGLHDGAETASGANPGKADTYRLNELPYVEGFETYAPGGISDKGLWNVRGEGTAVVQNTSVFSGTQALELSAGSAGLHLGAPFDGSAAPFAWIDFRLRPARFEAGLFPALDASPASAFFFNDADQVLVFDRSGGESGLWRAYPHPASASGWERVTLREDYAAQTYDLWVNGFRVAANIRFAGRHPYLARFGLRQDAPESAFLDDLSIASTRPSGLDSDADGLVDEREDPDGNGKVSPGETDPFDPDTDNDGLIDSLEAAYGLDPTSADAAVARLVEESPGVFSWQTAFAADEGYTEGTLDGQNGWAASGATVTTDETAQLTAEAAEASLEHLIGAGLRQKIWIQFDAALVIGALPNIVDGDGALCWGFPHADTLSVWNNGTGEWEAHAVDPAKEEWNRYTLFLDYAAGTWLLCRNGVVLVRNRPLPADRAQTLSKFQALQATAGAGAEIGVATLDNISVSTAEPEGLDFDGDGLSNALERRIGSNPLSTDTDSDGMGDAWEYQHGLDLLNDDAELDTDGDGLSFIQEYAYNTDPNVADFDGDGFHDGFEILRGTDSEEYDTGAIGSVGEPWILSSISGAFIDGVEIENGLALLASGTGFKTHGNDSAGYAHRQISGDFEYFAKVEFPPNASNAWRAGLMIREELSAKAGMAAILVSPDGTLYQQDRPYLNAKVGRVGDRLNKSSIPVWLKIKRQGNNITVWSSADRDNWELFYNSTLALSDAILCGPILFSGADDRFGTAEFTQHLIDYDFDSDGVLASEEALLGSSDTTADTDLDGIDDGREIYEFFSDPLLQDLGPVVTLSSARGRDLSVVSGDWIGYGNGRYADTIRGTLAWPTRIAASGLYQLTVDAGFAVNDTHDSTLAVGVSVDGVFVGNLNYDVQGQSSESASILLPWLSDGSHEISLELKNTYLFRKVWIDSIALQDAGGIDSDSDGQKDWVTSRLMRLNSVDYAEMQSATSPACLTGIAKYPEFTLVDGSPILPGPNARWAVDVDVPEEGVRSLHVVHENGAFDSSISLQWSDTNLFTASDLTIRRGDSLKFVALPNGGDPTRTAELWVNGSLAFSADAQNHHVHTFNREGVYLIEGIYDPDGTVETSSLTVTVVDAVWNGQPLAVTGQTRAWSGSNVSGELIVESDARMVFERSQNGVDFNIRIDASEDRYVWTRLEEGGPVVAQSVVRGLEVATLANSGMFSELVYEDGVTRVLMPVVASSVPEDLTLTLDVLIGGVLFEDGSTLIELEPADFDQTGVSFVRFLKSAGKSATCHTTRLYQDGVYIGRNK